MKYKTANGCWIRSAISGILLAVSMGLANAASIAEVAKVGPSGIIGIGAGKAWPTPRFIVNGDCVTDKLTGLMWARDGSFLGTGTWGSSTIYGTAQYKVAQMNTNSSANGYHLCGYTDWRLPNINELKSLINYAATQANSTPGAWLNSQVFTNVMSSIYSSSTAYNGDIAMSVNFSDGITDITTNTSGIYIWPVRGGQ